MHSTALEAARLDRLADGQDVSFSIETDGDGRQFVADMALASASIHAFRTRSRAQGGLQGTHQTSADRSQTKGRPSVTGALCVRRPVLWNTLQNGRSRHANPGRQHRTPGSPNLNAIGRRFRLFEHQAQTPVRRVSRLDRPFRYRSRSAYNPLDDRTNGRSAAPLHTLRKSQTIQIKLSFFLAKISRGNWPPGQGGRAPNPSQARAPRSTTVRSGRRRPSAVRQISSTVRPASAYISAGLA